MAVTVNTDMIDVQILTDAARGVFKQKKAFMGSVLVSSGAVMVSPTMEKGPEAIGKKIDIPYFGTIGEFTSNADGSGITPSKLQQVLEQATIARDSLAIEVSQWAVGVGAIDPAVGDPYDESANQMMDAATRAMDKVMIDEFKTTPLLNDVYSATVPVYTDWDKWIDCKTLWGDEQDAIVAAVVHSQSLADMAKLKDSSGRPLLLNDQTQGPEAILRFCGVPLVVSDRVPLDGSTMGTVVATGTTPPTVTLSGTPKGPWKLQIDCVVGGAAGTATFRFSTDGGNTWSATLTTPAGGGNFVLTDTAVDSLVGVNGVTGITANFGNATYNADNLYVSTANLKVTDMILQRGAGSFWYNARALQLQTDRDILVDALIAAMHLYRTAKLYRRRRGGSRPGCVAFKHNVRGYIG